MFAARQVRPGVRTVALAVLLHVCATPALAQSVVGILGIASEIGPIESRLQGSRDVVAQGYVFRVGTLNGRQVVVGRSGAGKVNATIIATLLIEKFNPSAILFSGTAGAVDPALRPGDVVIGATMAQHDVGQQTTEGIRRRGVRNAVTGNLEPLLVPAPANLLAVARQSAQNLRLASIRAPGGEERTPRIVEGVIVTGDVFLSDASSSSGTPSFPWRYGCRNGGGSRRPDLPSVHRLVYRHQEYHGRRRRSG